MNKVILMGRLTRDPDMRYTQGDNSMAVARYTLAVDRRRTNAEGQRETDFIGCVSFGRQAEFAGRYLHQGTKVVLTGRIQTGSYVNRDGQKVYTTDVIGEDLEFAESKAASEGRQSGSGYNNYNRQAPSQSGNSGYSRDDSASRREEFGSASRDNNHSQSAPRDDYSSSVGEGFMNIPEGIEDEGLPFN